MFRLPQILLRRQALLPAHEGQVRPRRADSSEARQQAEDGGAEDDKARENRCREAGGGEGGGEGDVGEGEEVEDDGDEVEKETGSADARGGRVAGGSADGEDETD